MEKNVLKFSLSLNATVYSINARTPSSRWLDWQETDKGPGIFEAPNDLLIGIRGQWLNDADLRQLVNELTPIENLRYLYLAENRNVTNKGMLTLSQLKQLRYLNISSCDINNDGMAFLPSLINLEYLDMSYCNRLNEGCAKYFQKLPNLSYLNIQGVPKINTNGVKKFKYNNRVIYKD